MKLRSLPLRVLSRSILIIVALTLVLGVFYWFSYRPSVIKKECTQRARHDANEVAKLYDDDVNKISRDEVQALTQLQARIYEFCLHENGL
jgi:uncharacterized protein HemX